MVWTDRDSGAWCEMVGESSAYSIASGHGARFFTRQDGKVEVNVKSTSSMNIREVYAGAATAQFRWVSTGKSRYWQFSPALQDPKPVEFTRSAAEDGEGQIVTVDFAEPIFPTVGLANSSVNGAIAAPAIHFDLPHAYDVWVFLLRSPKMPIKLDIEKASLTVKRGSAQVTAYLSKGTDEDERETLRADVNTTGEGLGKVWLSLRRSFFGFSFEETIGEIKTSMDQFTWKPLPRNLDLLFMTPSNASLTAFLGFLQSLGAEVNADSFPAARYLPNNFVFCDGPATEYALCLRGEKHLIERECDECKITLRT